MKRGCTSSGPSHSMKIRPDALQCKADPMGLSLLSYHQKKRGSFLLPSAGTSCAPAKGKTRALPLVIKCHLSAMLGPWSRSGYLSDLQHGANCLVLLSNDGDSVVQWLECQTEAGS